MGPKSALQLSYRSRDLPPSGIRQIFSQAIELEEQGKDVVRLDIGDPDLRLPERISRGIEEALHSGRTHYSPLPGLRELRERICSHLERRSEISCHSEHIVITQGATQGLHSVLLATCDRSSALLLPEIYWPNYLQQAILASVRIRFYPLLPSFQPDLHRLHRLYVPGLRALVLNSPGNPTGAVFSPETVKEIYKFARDHNIWIISDEAYTDFVFRGDHLSPLQLDRQYPEEERRVFGIYSFSKTYAATGLRMGWIVLPRRDLFPLVGRLNEPLTGSLNTPSQWGMVRAFEADDIHLRYQTLRRRWSQAAETLKEFGLTAIRPEGGLFYFLDISQAGLSSQEVSKALLKEQHVATVPGRGFGLIPTQESRDRIGYDVSPLADRHLRVCFAVPPERFRQGAEKIASFLFRREPSELSNTV